MREILFRGKQHITGEWLTGSLVIWHDGSASIEIGDLNTPMLSVVRETVGQFTGLTDKNGKKIFEGDIIQFDYIGKNLGVYGDAVVIFESGKFGVKWGWHKDFVPLDGFANTTQEIIGNIHDNPEPLENS